MKVQSALLTAAPRGQALCGTPNICEETEKTMAKTQYTKAALKEAITGKLQRHFACEVKDAKKDQIY